MEIIKVDPKKPKLNHIKKIVAVLKKGELVVLPTETVYTFAVDATNDDAIRSVYKIKGRDFNKPLHVVISVLEMAKKYVEVSEKAKLLADKFLPGPLTLVLKKKNNLLPPILTANLPTLGIRIPNLKLCLFVAENLGLPYTTTSANLAGGPNPYSVDDVLGQLDDNKRKLINLVVDVGSLPKMFPSTLIDLTESPPKILREGPITKEQIERVLLKKVEVSS